MAAGGERRVFLKYLFSLSAFIAGSKFSFGHNEASRHLAIGPKTAWSMAPAGKRVKKIAVEEHFMAEEYLSWLGSRAVHKVSLSENMSRQGIDIGEGRIRDMDQCGVDMQILSLAEPPGLAPYPSLDPFNAEDAVALARIINDKLSNAVTQHPKRFAGFCCLPLQDPDAAADELERAVTKLGLKGTMVNDTTKRWLSDEKYEVIFERLARLDVPIYIHAMGPTNEEAGLHVVPDVKRLIESGIFDKYPGLKIILGHGGESLPFWLWRVNSVSRTGDKGFMEYFKEHFYVTISAQFWTPVLAFLITVMGADRIMFATDYPHPDWCKHVDFIDSAPISDSEREKICHLNAEKLFKL